MRPVSLLCVYMSINVLAGGGCHGSRLQLNIFGVLFFVLEKSFKIIMLCSSVKKQTFG